MGLSNTRSSKRKTKSPDDNENDGAKRKSVIDIESIIPLKSKSNPRLKKKLKTLNRLLEELHEATTLENDEDPEDAALANLEKTLRILQCEVDKISSSSNNIRTRSVSSAKSSIQKLEQRVEVLKIQMDSAEQKIVELENKRKQLHNQIIVLKGNIRVFCRVRPPKWVNDVVEPSVSYPCSMQKKGHFIEMRKRQFEFDRVFNEQFTQEDLFAAFSPLIQSALDGKKVCIFAYGQTGSGKSHTIMGNPERSELRGLIPRSLEQIFQCRESSKGKCRYDLKLSMLEIYNGTIYDLLLRSPKKSPGWTHLDIKHDDQFGGSHLVGLSIVNVLSEERTMELVRQATDRRSVRGTKMNDKSSRSHSVFTLRISGINERTNEVSNGLLNIIDLAGSERLDINDSMSKEEQAESTQINSSLLQLRKVIRALVKKEERVPFRGNALPRFLQPCLEGDTKTLMIVNISADTERKTVEESLRSLKFGSEARN